MQYTVSIRPLALQWLTGDKPDVAGTIYANGAAPTLLGATLRLQRLGANEIISERISDSIDSSGNFTFVLPNILTTPASGKVYISALEDSTARATLDSGITDSATSATITVTAGTLPDSGWVKINSEWMQFTKVSATSITLSSRGSFATTAASHSTSDVLSFARVKETCTPYYHFQIKDENL